MTDKPTTAQELEELFGKVDLEQVIWDSIVEEMKEAHNKQLFNDSVSYDEDTYYE